MVIRATLDAGQSWKCKRTHKQKGVGSRWKKLTSEGKIVASVLVSVQFHIEKV